MSQAKFNDGFQPALGALVGCSVPSSVSDSYAKGEPLDSIRGAQDELSECEIL